MENLTREQLAEMGSEWMKMQFVTREKHFSKLFSEVPTYYYIALLSLRKRMGQKQERMYLKQISEEMDMPIKQVSGMIQRMQEKGYVYWTHDADDHQGTYITLSETGYEALERQQEKIGVFFEKAIREYGAERFTELVKLRGDFNDTMDKLLLQEE